MSEQREDLDVAFGEQNPYRPAWQGVPLWQRFRGEEWPTLRELVAPARRISGWVWVPVVLCLWPFLLFLTLYPMARSARRTARQVFTVPGVEVGADRSVRRVQKVRGWLALGAGFLVLAVYGSADDWSEANDQLQLRLAVTPWLVLLTAPAVVAVLFRLAPPSARPTMRAHIRPAVRVALQYVGACTAIPVLLWAANLLEDAVEGMFLRELFTLASLAPAIWVLMFVAFASPTVVRTAFRMDRVHAVFPPLLTGVLVWELTAIGLAIGGLPPGPPAVQACFVLGGPLSVSAVAWWEVWRLRTRYGVTLRRASPVAED